MTPPKINWVHGVLWRCTTGKKGNHLPYETSVKVIQQDILCLTFADMAEQSKKRRKYSNNKSILVVNDEWGTAKGGISTINREVAITAANNGIDVHALTLSTTSEDKDDALENGVMLIMPKIKENLQDKDPKLDWFVLHESFFPTLSRDVAGIETIIGHLPITGNEAMSLKEELFPDKKLVLFNHVIPEDIEPHKDSWTPERVRDRERALFKIADKADAVFSVGPRVYSHFENKYRAFTSKTVCHKKFLPQPSKSFFDIEIQKPKADGRVQILTFGRIWGVEKLKGYDIVAKAVGRAVKTLRKVKPQCSPVWIIRGVPEGEHQETREFLKISHGCDFLDIKLYPYGTQDDICMDLKQSHVCVMGSRSEPFGLVGMEAIASGLPVLVTKNSGLADFLYESFCLEAKEMVVDVGVGEISKENDVEKWADKVIQILTNYDNAFEFAQRMKQSLQNCDAIKNSQEELLGVLNV
ncbi:uncharacterized protein LOC144361794 [Saccoglossus kowalevskii]